MTMRDDDQPVSRESLEAERLSGLSWLSTDIERSHEARVMRKRQPKPGHYPEDFSPYKLSDGTDSFVGLTHLELKKDLQLISQGYLAQFSSTYFDELGCENAVSQPAAKRMKAGSGSRAMNNAIYHSRLPAPSSKAEEATMLMTAIKASLAATKRQGYRIAHVVAKPADSTRNPLPAFCGGKGIVAETEDAPLVRPERWSAQFCSHAMHVTSTASVERIGAF
eukprot:221642-Hanusia_phi.AAC.2